MSVLTRVTFDGNSLTGTWGFTSLGGTNSADIAITETDVGVGIYAADWTSDADAYGQIDFASSQDEVFCYIYFIKDGDPAGSLTILQMLDTADAAIGEINLETDGTLKLKNNDSDVGSASSALTDGVLYRIGLHYKKGTGSDAELHGYVASKHTGLGTAFAASTTESNTTAIDHLRCGAVDNVALDGRIGLVAARSDVMPGSWLDVHDVVFHTYGLMYGEGGQWAEGDLTPATERAAKGEADRDTFGYPSFRSQGNWGGGVGQMRDLGQDKFLTGIGDGSFDGHFFPPRAKKDVATGGGTDSFYINLGSVLWGHDDVNGTWDRIGSATTVAETEKPVHQPVVDSAGNAYYASDTNELHVFNGSSVTDVTPTDLVDRIKHVSRYGRHIWAFGETDIPTFAYNATNSDVGSMNSTTETHEIILAATPADREYTFTVCWATMHDGGGAPTPDVSLNAESQDNGWYVLGEATETDIAGILVGHTGGGADAKSVKIDFVASSTTNTVWEMRIATFEGIDPNGIATFTSNTQAGTTSVIAVNGTSGDNQLAGIAVNSNDDFSPEASWTEIGEVDSSQTSQQLQYRASSDAAVQWTGLQSGDNKIAFHLAVPSHPAAGSTQFTIIATADEGNTWAAAPANFSAAILGEIRASEAASEYLWLATSYGLWRMQALVDETGGGEEIINIALTGPHDKWSVPSTDNAGYFLETFEGLLYYPVGGTVRRFAPGSDAPNENRVLWPSADWAANGGTVQALTTNEAGVWWGADGFLWWFNGRGIQQINAEPSANDFDMLYWHQGNLYMNTNPSDYFDYGYANVRPDVQGITATDFTTGYIITSSWDFQKAADPKIIKIFESQASFTGGDANSGTITWHYRNGCGTDADPGVAGGGDTGSSWTEIGTHTFSDGGYKVFDLDPPITCYRVFIRATITVGSSGFPVPHVMTAYGVTVMPQISTFGGTFNMSTGMLDREGNVLYEQPSHLRKLVQSLKAARKPTGANPVADDTLYFTLFVDDGTDGGEEILVTFAQLQWGMNQKDEQQNSYQVAISPQFYEIPR